MSNLDPRRVIQRLIRRIENRERARKRPTPLVKPAPMVIRIPDSYQSQMARMREPEAFNDPKVIKRVKRSIDERTHPLIKEFHRAMVKECTARQIPIWGFEFYRSHERQAKLFAQGRTSPGRKVTWARPGESAHQYGCAEDIISATKLWDQPNRYWDLIGIIGKEVARKRNIPMEWGGDWKKGKNDRPHWQLKNWREWRAFHSRFGDRAYWRMLAALEKGSDSRSPFPRRPPENNIWT